MAERATALSKANPPDTRDAGTLAAFYLDRSYAAANIGAEAQRPCHLKLALQYSPKSNEIMEQLESAEENSGNLLSAPLLS